jgi:hypothetical protein
MEQIYYFILNLHVEAVRRIPLANRKIAVRHDVIIFNFGRFLFWVGLSKERRKGREITMTVYR